MIIFFTEQEYQAIKEVINSIPGASKDIEASIESSKLINLDIVEYNGKPRHRLRINKVFTAEYISRIGNLAATVVPMLFAGSNLFKQAFKDFDTIVRRNKILMEKKEFSGVKEEEDA